jgi:uncharacterized protein (DUF2249 family)
VRFEGADIGLFPFTTDSLQQLFLGLNDRFKGVRKNPRGLLEHIVSPVLRDEREALLEGDFPHMKLAVELDEPAYWSAFAARYLGGWSTDNKNRLRELARAWVRARDAEDAARLLEPFLVPLRFPDFGQKAASTPSIETPRPTPREQRSGRTSGEQSLEKREPEELRTVLNDIGKWARGEPLISDDEPRRLLYELIKSAVAWDDEQVPVDVYKSRTADKSCVRFEDQRSKLRRGQTYAIDLPRSEHAGALIEALARWEWQGKRSWGFPDGEMHKRTVARWLRLELPRIIDNLQPPKTLDRDAAISHGVRMLSIAALMRRNADFSTDRASIVRELLRDLQPSPPVAASKEDAAMVGHVWDAHSGVKDFVQDELSAPQGGRKNVNFIDPLPLLKHARSPHVTPIVQPLDREFLNDGRWSKRFAPLAATDKMADLPAVLGARHAAIRMSIADVQAALIDADIAFDDLASGVETYCIQVADLLPVQADAFPLPDRALDPLRSLYAARGVTWARNISGGHRAEGVVAQLTMPIGEFQEAVNGIRAAHDFLRRLEAEVTGHEKTLIADGDPAVLLNEIRTKLAEIADDS